MTKSNKEKLQSFSNKICIRQQTLNFPNLSSHIIFWVTLIVGLVIDLWSKKAVFDWLQQKPGSTIPVIDGYVKLVIALNNGAAFGIAAGQYRLLIAVSVIALVVIFAVFFFSRTQQTIVHIALALFAAGVSGNLWDRIFNDGLVRDFIDIVYWPGRHWPAFNLADTMLCIGVILLVFSTFFTGKSAQKHVQQHK